MTPVALWQRTPLAGLANALRFGLRGVRFHPAARIYGEPRALEIGRGAKIGAGCVFNLAGRGAIRLGPGVWTYRDVEFHTENRIEIGAGCSFQRGVLINGTAAIGRGCIFAPGVFVSSGKHIYDLRPAWPIRAQEALISNAPGDPDVARYVLDKPVGIDEDCWLGAHVAVAPGVRIGRGAIIGANSVVTSDVAPYAIVAGAPARPINLRLVWRPPEALDATLPDARPYLYSGFESQERTGRLSAIVRGDVSLALKPSGSNTLLLSFEASAPGATRTQRTDRLRRRADRMPDDRRWGVDASFRRHGDCGSAFRLRGAVGFGAALELRMEREMKYCDLRPAIAAYREGRNVMQTLREMLGEKVNTPQIIEIAYDLQAGSYVDYVRANREFWRAYTSELATILGHHIAAGDRLLEAGTGEMTTLAGVANGCYSGVAAHYAMDLSWSRIAQGRAFARNELRPELNAVLSSFVGDLLRLPLRDCSIDVVWTSHALEPNAGREKEALAELFRIARKRVVLFEPSYEDNSEAGRARMDTLGYIRGLPEAIAELGGRLEEKTVRLARSPIRSIRPMPMSSRRPVARRRHAPTAFGPVRRHGSPWSGGAIAIGAKPRVSLTRLSAAFRCCARSPQSTRRDFRALPFPEAIADPRLRQDNPRRGRVALDLRAQLADEDAQILRVVLMRRPPDRG